MDVTLFEQYSAAEFIREFFRTLLEILLGLAQAFVEIVHDIGPFRVLLAGYLIMLLLVVVSAIKAYQRQLESERQAIATALAERRAEAQRRREARDERVAQYKQRDQRIPGGKRLPPGAVAHYQGQKLGQRAHARSRSRL